MKKTLSTLILLGLISAQPLFAMSVGRDGAPYTENAVQWQPVKYEDRDTGFVAALPGEPKSGFSNGNVYAYSKFKQTSYEIHSSLNKRYQPPEEEKLFLDQIETAFSEEAQVKSISSEQSNILYIAEIHFKSADKIVRLYCSSNQLYWAIVAGDDLTLAPDFFETIQITK